MKQLNRILKNTHWNKKTTKSACCKLIIFKNLSNYFLISTTNKSEHFQDRCSKNSKALKRSLIYSPGGFQNVCIFTTYFYALRYLICSLRHVCPKMQLVSLFLPKDYLVLLWISLIEED